MWQSSPATILGPDGKPWETAEEARRRWEAGKTNRLNAAHWADADGKSLNQSINEQGLDIAHRCELEISRNPFLAGVIETHVTDLVGSAPYPMLEVYSDDEEYNQQLEQAWGEFWAMPDVNGQWSGASFLQSAIRMFWARGESVWQKVNKNPDRKDTIPTQTRLQNVHPRRLQNPMNVFLSRIILGIEIDRLGRPINYYLTDFDLDERGQITTATALTARPIPAENIIHRFRLMEPGQLRGVPWAACSLQCGADLRDYDDQVLDAARQAADSGVVLYTDHPEAPYQPENGSMPIQRRRMVTAPPGWKMNQIKAEQPTLNYVEYRSERHRELGRPVNMPLMMVKLDSSKHNYSAARFDAQVYQRGNRVIQSWLDETLSQLLNMVDQEARLKRRVKRRPKGRVKYEWQWPVPPHVDPSREAKGNDLELRNGSATYTEVLADKGITLEQHTERKKREQKLIDEGLLPDLAAQGTKAPGMPVGLPSGGAGGNGAPMNAKQQNLNRAWINEHLLEPMIRDIVREEIEEFNEATTQEV